MPKKTNTETVQHLIKDYDKTAPLELEVSLACDRFAFFQEGMKGSVTMLKLMKYFAGLEVGTLRDLHQEIFGETRGSGEGAEMTLEAWLESKLEVTSRTARRYHTFFMEVAQNHPQAAEALNGWWKENAAKALEEIRQPAPEPQDAKKAKDAATTSAALVTLPAAAMQSLCKQAAGVLQDLLGASDEDDLCSFFDKPERDITPPDEAAPVTASPDKKQKLISWWHDFARRAKQNEFLRLPKRELEAVATTLEEAAQQAKEALKKKGAPKAA